MKFVSLRKSSVEVPLRDLNWKIKAIKESWRNYQFGRYNKWFEPKFSNLEKGSRLIAKQLAKIIIRKSLTLEEREIFKEMLFYQKKALAFNFMYQEKVKLKVLSLQMIEMIEYKA